MAEGRAPHLPPAGPGGERPAGSRQQMLPASNRLLIASYAPHQSNSIHRKRRSGAQPHCNMLPCCAPPRGMMRLQATRSALQYSGPRLSSSAVAAAAGWGSAGHLGQMRTFKPAAARSNEQESLDERERRERLAGREMNWQRVSVHVTGGFSFCSSRASLLCLPAMQMWRA